MVSKELPPSAAIMRYSHNEQIKHSIVFAPAPDPPAQQIVMGAAVFAYSGPRTEVPCNIVSCRPWFSSWGLHANALIEGRAPNVRHDALSGVAAREGMHVGTSNTAWYVIRSCDLAHPPRHHHLRLRRCASELRAAFDVRFLR